MEYRNGRAHSLGFSLLVPASVMNMRLNMSLSRNRSMTMIMSMSMRGTDLESNPTHQNYSLFENTDPGSWQNLASAPGMEYRSAVLIH